ncbi:MAG: hypothetical protein AUG80_15235 [Candidatus Rokubacteria bacterium 13_1_20CM_4_68_9]|nr:MAG: hypothetical protein AUH75_00370 [Gemmatimonadetes bacterium 13_1_40CM_4_65_7]OLD95992.1 MAG: hypothetical protein AUG80_15235 [Candidatus Rokubacteria bacterium 13_1_20CM_4_68_9]
MCFIELGPEQCEDFVATVRATGRSRGEVGQQGRTLRLMDEASDVSPSGGGAQLKGAEDSKLDHARFLTAAVRTL